MKLLLVCLLAIGHVTFANTFPKGVPIVPCRVSDPELSTCFSENLSSVFKMLPEWNLQPIDPLNIDFMNVEGDLELGKVKVNMQNIIVYGGSKTIVRKLKVDTESLTGEITYFIPEIRVFCDYSATGRMFLLPLDSSAHYEGNFTDIVLTENLRLGSVQRRNKKYFTVEKGTKKMRIDKAHIQITSIDPAQQPQVKVIQDFFNENDRLILDAITPFYEKYAGDIEKRIAERYVRRIPVNKWLLLE